MSEDPIKNIEATKEELSKIKAANHNIDIESIFDIVKNTATGLPTARSKKNDHVPINTLEIIRQKLAVTKEENGSQVPVYTEEDKVKIIFGLLAEKGLNLLDNLEKILERDGYKYSQMGDGMMEEGSNKLVENINDTFSKTTDILKEIAEMQFKKSKLELEKENLRIQDYKAKLKEKELAIKEKKLGTQSPNTTNVIAVGSQAELIAIMKGQKEALTAPKNVDIVVEEEDIEDGEE